jgi:formylglycine-generating enzyme
MRRLLVLITLVFSLPAQAVTIDWVPIGNPNNAPDTLTNCYAAGCGSVAYDYWISKYEVTNAQYAEFLNAKAASDPLGLYNTYMFSDADFGGITRLGEPGSFTYTVKAGFATRPVNYVSFYDSLRFSNWLNNGQGIGNTETGAYTLLGGTATPSNGTTVLRNPDADIFLPSENEWYKAAYYDGLSATYFDYPAGTNARTVCAPPGATPNTANCLSSRVTNVGAYTGSASPNGTYDQGGNMDEWNEQIWTQYGSGPLRGLRGGGWLFDASGLAAESPSYSGLAGTDGDASVGFRVASLVPEPGTGLLVTAGVLGLSASRRRRANPIGSATTLS